MTEWRISPSFPFYEVSETGDVRRAIKARTSPVGKLLKPVLAKRGYLMFSMVGECGPKSVAAHRLVCEAWHGPCPPNKSEVDHFDGNKTNNHFKNLRWVSRAENEANKRRLGWSNSGELHPLAKLTDDQVCQIRSEYTGRHGQLFELAARYGVHKDYIFKLTRGNRRRQAALKARGS